MFERLELWGVWEEVFANGTRNSEGLIKREDNLQLGIVMIDTIYHFKKFFIQKATDASGKEYVEDRFEEIKDILDDIIEENVDGIKPDRDEERVAGSIRWS